jgi:hypothetical protein
MNTNMMGQDYVPHSHRQERSIVTAALAETRIPTEIEAVTEMTVHLINVSPDILNPSKRQEIEAFFPDRRATFKFLNMTKMKFEGLPWEEYLDYCSKHFDQEKDAILLPFWDRGKLWAAIVMSAVENGYTHLFFDQGKIMKLVDIEMRGEPRTN